MQELEKILEILDKIQFFGGQRAGRELWNDKPRKVQEDDISSFNRDIESVRDFIRKHMNDGWIPVEKELPENEGKYLVTFRETETVGLIGYGNCKRNVLGKPIGFGWYDRATATYFSDDAVIAWRALPEPYQLEATEAQRPEWQDRMLHTFLGGHA